METKKNKKPKILMLVAFLWVGLLTVACSDTSTYDHSPSAPELEAPDSEGPVPTPIPERDAIKNVIPLWETKVSSGKAWTAHVDRQLEVIGGDLLDVIPKDRALFCPNYDKLSVVQRKQFWSFFLSAMVNFESRFKTNAKLTEKFTDSSGRKVVSRGLLQISFESGNAYGCGLKSGQDLHDPLKNLSCGIRILNRWIARDGRIAGRVSSSWKGGARYWAVLRSSNSPYKSILKWSQNLSICK